MVILICIFSPNSEVGREWQNKIILFCYSLPTSEFGENSLGQGVKIKGRSGNLLNHTYFFSWPYHSDIFVLLYDLSNLSEFLLQVIVPDVLDTILSLCYRRHAVNIADRLHLHE